MAQPEWITGAGNLGTYPSAAALSIQLHATAVLPATNLKYTLISGSLPAGDIVDLIITEDGVIKGTPKVVQVQTQYDFTIRVTDEFGDIRDRTFFIIISGIAIPQFITHSGVILNVLDSTWVNYRLDYTNPINETLKIVVTSGSLPLGLEISSTGLIRGYAAPPYANGIAENKTYDFTLTIISSLGLSTGNFSITIRNHRLTHPQNSRPPVLLNSNPLTLEISKTDPNYDYYLNNRNNTIYVESGAVLTFKFIGKDFDNTGIVYEFNDLPLGITGDTNTGWITGIPRLNVKGLSKYNFTVRVAKAINGLIQSKLYYFTISVTKEVNREIIWNSDATLAILDNGQISTLQVSATASLPLLYRLVGGSLPPNLSLLETGEIVGRTSFQPTSDRLSAGEESAFIFDIEAFNPEFILLSSTKTFTIIIQQVYNTPLEDIYIKAYPSLERRTIVNELLTNTSLIPDELLYRPTDPYFGKSTSVSFVHMYGVTASTPETYLSAMDKNHYTTSVVLGDIKTAIAKDEYGNIQYEVVYSEIVDPNDSTKTFVFWPKNIPLDNNTYVTASQSLHASDDISISSAPITTRSLYPVSLKAMQIQISNMINQNTSDKLLPKWMTGQQTDGNILGYIPAWVICYTLPGQSETIKYNIVNNWGHTLNEIDFTIDRYTIDKSATYNWNAYLNIPAWTELPAAYPPPNPVNSKDIVVMFPRKTILPK